MLHNYSLLGFCLQARCEWGLQPSQESLITSVVFVGTLSGAYAWGSLGDSKGRKLGFFATALFTVTFGLLSAVAPSFGVSSAVVAVSYGAGCCSFGARRADRERHEVFKRGL